MKSETFPLNESQIFLPGPAGKIEVKAAGSKNYPSIITVVICHPHPLFGGTMENKVVTTVFRTFKNMGADVVRFNYRGVGKSEGSYDAAKGEVDDLMAVCDWVKAVKPKTALWLVGFSFGSYIAARAALSVDASQLVTIAPAVEHFQFDTVEDPHCPWLVLQGEEDDVVPPAAVYDWFHQREQAQATQSFTLIKFPDTGHFFHGKLTHLKEVLEKHYSNYFL